MVQTPGRDLVQQLLKTISVHNAFPTTLTVMEADKYVLRPACINIDYNGMSPRFSWCEYGFSQYHNGVPDL